MKEVKIKFPAHAKYRHAVRQKINWKLGTKFEEFKSFEKAFKPTHQTHILNPWKQHVKEMNSTKFVTIK